MALTDINNVIQQRTGIHIKIPDLTKTLRLGKEQPLLVLPFFKKRKKFV